MTSKELMYVEDALGHEKYFQTSFRETADKLSDNSLRELVRELSQTHAEIYSDIYGLL